ncbi:MAG: hypothetical protein A3J94_06655 [Syntrophus sp. RIFOXYC2_FULL_54_9]|nr:MAG: hypothetical protein A2X92_08375 [Syntrophus sp. GWC2_56_31]OHE28340.1 MAG: hypothetical protein A3J94_06655 [Syntrophus sp. RIFOXYC2_FULL_54_9]HBB16602.1 hypothetical protein [Syntrophus sp. (in: bacteria)]
MRNIEKKNPKKRTFRIRTNSRHRAGRNSFGRTFRFRRIVAATERAIVKLAMLALIAKMIRVEKDLEQRRNRRDPEEAETPFDE